MLPVGTNFELFLTCVKGDGQWLKVWGQMDTKLADEVAEALVQLEPYLQSGQFLPHPLDLRVNDKCVAKFVDDGKWYRARITSLSKIASGKIEVNFLDYGNCEEVAITDIRKVEDSLLLQPPLATEFIIDGIISSGETWSEEALIFVQENLYYDMVAVHVVGSENAIPKIELLCPQLENASLAKLLQKRGLAEAIVPKEYPVLNLDVGSKCSVYVSHIESLNKFWIQLVENEDLLNERMADVETYATAAKDAAPCSSVSVGLPCITTFSEDCAFYRAKVTQIIGGQPFVTFVDFGNSEMKMPSELMQIPDTLISFPAQAVECSMNGSERMKVTPDIVTSFTELTLSRPVMCTIISKTSRGTCVVNLEGDGVNLFTLLTVSLVPEFIPALKYDKLVLSIAEGYEVKLCHVETVSHFYCNVTAQQCQIDDLMDRLEELMATGGQSVGKSECVPGLPCCVKYSVDDMWYRAEVLEVFDDGQIKVHYVDYGNSEVVTLDRVRRLASNFVRALPAQAVACHLSNAQDLVGLSADILDKMTEDKVLAVKVNSVVNDQVIVDLFDMNKTPFVYINEVLKGMAASARPNTTVLSPPSTFISIPTPSLGSVEKLYVLVVDEDSKFFGQLDRFDLEELDTFQNQLTEYYASLPRTAPCLYADNRVHVGEYCCAQFSEDEQFYRGKVLSEDSGSGSVVVFFVDYGNSEVKSKGDVKQLAPEFAAKEQQGILCQLADFHVAAEILSPILAENTVELRMPSSAVHNVYKVSLTASDLNKKIIEQLSAAAASGATKGGKLAVRSYIKPPLMLEEEVIVTHYTSPLSLMCQLQRSQEVLLALMDEIDQYGKALSVKDGCLTEAVVGSPCLAQYLDDTWYRAQIISAVNTAKAIVQYVDFGNSEEVMLSSVKAIPESFMVLPRQCVECALDGVPKRTNWTAEELAELDSVTMDQNLIAVFTCNTSTAMEPFTVELMDETRCNILTKIKISLDTPSVTAVATESTDDGWNETETSIPISKPRNNYETKRDGWGNQDQGKASKFGQRSGDNFGWNDSGGDVSHNSSFGKSNFTSGFRSGNRFERNSSGGESSWRDSSWRDACRNRINTGGYGGSNGGGSRSFGGGGFGQNKRDGDTFGGKKPGFGGSSFQRSRDDEGGSSFTGRTQGFGSTTPRSGFGGGAFGKESESASNGWDDSSNRSTTGFGNRKGFGARDERISDQGFGGAKRSGFGGAGSSFQQTQENGSSFGNRSRGFGSNAVVPEQTTATDDDWDAAPTPAPTSRSGFAGGSKAAPSGGFGKSVGNDGGGGFGKSGGGGFGRSSDTDSGFGKGSGGGFGRNTDRDGGGGFGKSGGGFGKSGGSFGKNSGGFGKSGGSDDGSTDGSTDQWGSTTEKRGFGAGQTGFLGKQSGFGNKGAFGNSDKSNEPLRRPMNASVGSSSLNIKKSGPYYTLELEKNQFKDISVVHIVSPTEFYVHLVEFSGKLQVLMDSISKRYQIAGSSEMRLRTLRTELPCCAKYHEDNMWYRAKVTAIHGESVEVLFVDYGNSEIVPLSNVKELQSEFMDLPAQALQCALENTRPTADSWSHDDVEQFRRLTHEKCFVAYVVNHLPNGTIEMKLIEPRLLDEIDVSRELVSMGHGRFAALPPTHGRGTTTTYTEPVIENGAQEETLMSWIVNPGEFYCHLASTKLELDAMMERMQRFFQSAEGGGLVITNWQPNSPCVAKFSEDNVWYRALLQDIQGESVTVFYVDFGNKETLQRTRIRANVPEYMSLPTQAIKCSLRDVKPVGESWKSASQQQTLEKYFGIKGTCTFHANFKGCYLVDLQVDGVSVASQLVVDGLASVNSRPSSFGSITSNDRISLKLNDYVSPFAPCDLPWSPGDYLDVVISGRGTTDSFWCQLVSGTDKRSNFSAQLSAIYDNLSLTDMKFANPTRGMACVVKSTAYDCWLRAVVESRPSPSKVHVFLVDIGHFEDVPIKKCKMIKEDLVSIPVEAFCCCLHGVPKGADTALLSELFMTDCLDKEFVAQLVAKNESSVYEVKLFSIGDDEIETNLCDLLMAKHGPIKHELVEQPMKAVVAEEPKMMKKDELVIFPSDENYVSDSQEEIKSENFQVLRSFSDPSALTEQYPERCIKLNEKFSADVIHVGSPGLFWLQRTDDEDELAKLVNMLAEQYSSGNGPLLTADELESGTPCIAQYAEDESWYRGTILAVEEEAVHVHFVDYGNSDSVAPALVCRPTPELLAISVLALQCELASVTSKEEDWTAEAIEEFETLVMDKPLTVEVIKQEGRKYHVRLLDMGLDVATSLANKGFTTLDVLSPLLLSDTVLNNTTNIEEIVISDATTVDAAESEDGSTDISAGLSVASTSEDGIQKPEKDISEENNQELVENLNRSYDLTQNKSECSDNEEQLLEKQENNENILTGSVSETVSDENGCQTTSLIGEERINCKSVKTSEEFSETASDTSTERGYNQDYNNEESKEIELQADPTSDADYSGVGDLIPAEDFQKASSLITSSPSSHGAREKFDASSDIGDSVQDSINDSSSVGSSSYVEEESLAVSGNLTVTSSSFELLFPRCNTDVGVENLPNSLKENDLEQDSVFETTGLSVGTIDSSDSCEVDSSIERTDGSVEADNESIVEEQDISAKSSAQLDSLGTTQPFDTTGLSESELDGATDGLESLLPVNRRLTSSVFETTATTDTFDGSGFLASSESDGGNEDLVTTSDCLANVVQSTTISTSAEASASGLVDTTAVSNLLNEVLISGNHIAEFPSPQHNLNQEETILPGHILQGAFNGIQSNPSQEIYESEGTEVSSTDGSEDINVEYEETILTAAAIPLSDCSNSSHVGSNLQQSEVHSLDTNLLETSVKNPEDSSRAGSLDDSGSPAKESLEDKILPGMVSYVSSESAPITKPNEKE